MHKYRGVFRFMADTRDDLRGCGLHPGPPADREFAEDSIQTKGRHRHWHDIDPTMPEALFEQAFIACCGRLLFCYNRCRLLREKLCSLDP